MEKFSIDYDQLSSSLNKKGTIRLADVPQEKIEKVGFDVVRFRDNQDTDMLWKIEDSNDGPVIVSLYDDNGALISESSKKDWDALSDKKTASVHIYYKGEPVLRVKTAELGIPFDEIDLFCRWLPKSLNKDADLQKTFIKKMASESPALLQKYPELQKGI